MGYRTPIDHPFTFIDQPLLMKIDECFGIQYTLAEFGIDRKLGEICLEKGYITRDAVADLLAGSEKARQKLAVLQSEGAEEDEESIENTALAGILSEKVDQGSVESGWRLRFGRLALSKKLVEEEAVIECLYLQARMREMRQTAFAH